MSGNIHLYNTWSEEAEMQSMQKSNPIEKLQVSVNIDRNCARKTVHTLDRIELSASELTGSISESSQH